jgi:N-acetylglucosaminyldiphosphoundecaprenol N-acetyl-beta-D-mannosaminyltransferase
LRAIDFGERMNPKRVDVLGVPVDCVDMQSAIAAVDGMIGGDRAQSIIAVNPEKVMKAQTNPRLLHSLVGAGLLIPDGIGIVMAASALGLGRMKRVPGSELMPAICELAARKGYRVFLFGAAPEVNDDATKTLLRRYPGLQIVGHRHGYVDDSSLPALFEEINRSRAQILFVALGSPRQELWMSQHLGKLDVKVCQGVGGTFDVIAGRVKRAPPIFLKLNLEWLYRLLSQPSRLARQTALPRFALQVLKRRFTH